MGGGLRGRKEEGSEGGKRKGREQALELATLAFTISLETVSASGSASVDVTTSNPRRTLFATGITALAVALTLVHRVRRPPSGQL